MRVTLSQLLQATKWRRIINPPGTPRQCNGWDCGVFTLMCASYVGSDLSFDFDQGDVDEYFRAMCALECTRQDLV